MKLRAISLLWLPVGVAALLLIILAVFCDWIACLFDRLEQTCDAGERLLCDWMSRKDPNP